MPRLIALAAAAGFTFFAFTRLDVSLIWIAAAWCAACMVAMWTSSGRAAKIIWFNIGAIILIAGLGDAYFRYTQSGPERRQEFADGAGVFVRDEVMGHRPAANFSTRTTLHYGEELVYDVVFTTDEHGLRISPPVIGEPAGCVLFFGCSYTFGEGVDDDETLPYAVAMKTGQRYQVYNFGYSGYGPHHMLAAIEGGLVDSAIDCRPTHAIYQSHPHHVLRAAGKWWWDRFGPRFVLRDNGDVERHGNFDDEASAVLGAVADNSALAMQLLDNIRPTTEDAVLTEAIVDRSRRLLQERYPGIEFHIVHWDVGDPQLFEGWEKRGVGVHPLSEMIDFNDPGWPEEYLLPHDVHPKARTYSLIADHVVGEILKPKRERGTAAK
jgi:hypothetical protein